MDSRQWILGPECKEFETALARYVGVRHCVLSNSATAGLWLTLRALGVKAGDEVLVPSHTAFPTIEAICFADATPGSVTATGSTRVTAPMPAAGGRRGRSAVFPCPALARPAAFRAFAGSVP